VRANTSSNNTGLVPALQSRIIGPDATFASRTETYTYPSPGGPLHQQTAAETAGGLPGHQGAIGATRQELRADDLRRRGPGSSGPGRRPSSRS
jgi:hypothetical protein